MATRTLLSCVHEAWKRNTRADAVLVAIVLVFFAGMLPLAATRVFDSLNFERYYTDAAVSMLQSHDYLTPRWGDETPRLHKPLPVYWLLIASYKLLGISFFSSRVPFLIAACGIIWLTYKLALKITADRETASTAAFVLVVNPIFISVAARSTPDILVTFFLLISAYGFVRLICYGETRPAAYWCAYGGAALGVAVKGLLPLMFVLYALVFGYLASSRKQQYRGLLHTGIILASGLIACSGFALMAWKHGPAALAQFWSDQLGQKIGASRSAIRIPAYFAWYVAAFLPWLLCLAYLFARALPRRPFSELERTICLFVLGWAALLPVVFGLGDRIQERYLVPVMPLVAVVIATTLRRFAHAEVAVIAGLLLNAVTIAFVALAIFGAMLLWQAGVFTKHFAGLMIVILAGCFVALRLERRHISTPAILSMSIFLLLPLGLAILSPFTLPDQTTQISRALRQLNREKRPVFAIGTNKLASRLRISTGGEYMIYQAKRADLLRGYARGDGAIFVLSQGEADHFPLNSLPLREVATYPLRVSLPKLAASLWRDEAKSYIDSRKVHCYALVSGAVGPENTR
jgi:4-amino-4-deoxy-L-arabinose transferase-like glycosyltransferase